MNCYHYRIRHYTYSSRIKILEQAWKSSLFPTTLHVHSSISLDNMLKRAENISKLIKINYN